MNTVELKNNLHRLIDKIEEESVLTAIATLLARENTPTADFWDELTPEQQAQINEGRQDITARLVESDRSLKFWRSISNDYILLRMSRKGPRSDSNVSGRKLVRAGQNGFFSFTI